MELEQALEELRAYGERGPSASRETCRIALIRIAALEEQLRNSEIFRRNAIDLQRDAEAKLAGYRTEVRDMRLAIVTLLEVWNAAKVDGDREFLLRVIAQRIEALEEDFGYDVVREDRDGAPFPDQPRDRRMWPLAEARRLTGEDAGSG